MRSRPQLGCSRPQFASTKYCRSSYFNWFTELSEKCIFRAVSGGKLHEICLFLAGAQRTVAVRWRLPLATFTLLLDGAW